MEPHYKCFKLPFAVFFYSTEAYVNNLNKIFLKNLNTFCFAILGKIQKARKRPGTNKKHTHTF